MVIQLKRRRIGRMVSMKPTIPVEGALDVVMMTRAYTAGWEISVAIMQAAGR
jgi:hypothetical protein